MLCLLPVHTASGTVNKSTTAVDVPLMLMSGLLLQKANLKRSPLPRCQQVLHVTSFLARNMWIACLLLRPAHQCCLCDKQAATSPFVSSKVQFANCKADLDQSTENHPDNDRLARQNTAPPPAADSQCSEVTTISFGHICSWFMRG